MQEWPMDSNPASGPQLTAIAKKTPFSSARVRARASTASPDQSQIFRWKSLVIQLVLLTMISAPMSTSLRDELGKDQIVADAESDPTERSVDNHGVVAGGVPGALGSKQMHLAIDGNQASIRSVNELGVIEAVAVAEREAGDEEHAVTPRNFAKCRRAGSILRLGKFGRAGRR